MARVARKSRAPTKGRKKGNLTYLNFYATEMEEINISREVISTACQGELNGVSVQASAGSASAESAAGDS